jgi:hypothetical protein
VPEIARFQGIVVAMFYNDHDPPHIHVRFGDHEATVRIRDGAVRGHLPAMVRARILEWCASHRDALQENWQRARIHAVLKRIRSLEQS